MRKDTLAWRILNVNAKTYEISNRSGVVKQIEDYNFDDMRDHKAFLELEELVDYINKYFDETFRIDDFETDGSNIYVDMLANEYNEKPSKEEMDLFDEGKITLFDTYLTIKLSVEKLATKEDFREYRLRKIK